MADTNFAFPSTLRKPETQSLGVGNWKFCSRMRFWGAKANFSIFHHGQHQFCVLINTQKTGDPNFRGIGNWKFCSRMCFGELWPFFPFSIMADTNFAFPLTLGKLETQTLGGVGNSKFCSRMRFWGATAIFSIFHNGRHQFCISIDTQKTGDPIFRGW